MSRPSNLISNRKSVLLNLKRIFSDPRFNLVLGVLLFAAGILEIFDTVIEDILHIEIKTAHGIMIFSISQIVISFTHIFEGIDNMAKMAELNEDENAGSGAGLT